MDTTIKSGLLQNISDVFTNPSTFAQRFFDQKPSFLVPLVAMIAVMVAVQFVYLNSMTFDEFIALSLLEVEPAGRAEARQGMQMLGQNGLLIASMVSVAIILPIIMALVALFYLLANRISGTPERGYGDWFRAAVWSSMPIFFLALFSFINIAISEPGTLEPKLLSLTNVNGLVMQIPHGEPGYNLFSAMDLTSFWSVAIMFFILRANEQSKVASLIIAALPLAIGVAIQSI